uniref:U5-like protein n=1 Tax=Glypta fumiferanae TaxID=389681 RepID=A0A0F6Y978_9HYME|nr:U5-like protein [Glypta fumiferanae]
MVVMEHESWTSTLKKKSFFQRNSLFRRTMWGPALSGVAAYALTYVVASWNQGARVKELKDTIASVSVKFYRRQNGKSALITWDDQQCAVWHGNILYVYDYWNNTTFDNGDGEKVSRGHSNSTGTETVLAYDFYEKSKYIQHSFPNEYHMRELFEVDQRNMYHASINLDDGIPMVYQKKYLITDELNIINVMFDALRSHIVNYDGIKNKDISGLMLDT